MFSVLGCFLKSIGLDGLINGIENKRRDFLKDVTWASTIQQLDRTT